MKRAGYAFGVIFLCLFVAGGGYLFWRLWQAPTSPMGKIVTPASPVILEAGDVLGVQVFAEAKSGLARVVLSVDGEIYAEENASGENELPVTFLWYATSLGSHTLDAVVYDAQNRASEPVSVLVGVKPRSLKRELDFAYVWGEGGGDASGDGAGGRVVPVAEALGNPLLPEEIGRQGSIQEFDDERVIMPLTEEDIAALAGAGDDIPLIAGFEAHPQRNGHQVQIGYHVEATDDLGIDRLEFSVENTLTGDESTRTTLCFGEVACTVDDVYPFASAGTWIFNVAAVDTTGQASATEVFPVEIVDGGEFEPAIVVLDVFAADLQVADFPDNQDRQLPPRFIGEDAGGAISERTGCLRGVVEPRENGNFVSATYLCDDDAPPNYHLVWRFTVVPSHAFTPPVVIRSQDDVERVLLSPGVNLALLHQDPLCGTPSSYRLALNWAPDAAQNGGHAFSLIPVDVVDIKNVPGVLCGEDNLVQGLEALQSDGGVQVSWNFVQASGVSDAVEYRLYRENLNGDAPPNLIEEGMLEAGALLAGDVPHLFTDSLNSCGIGRYHYSVVVAYASVPARVAASAIHDQPRCEAGSLANLAMDLMPGYAEVEPRAGWGFPFGMMASSISVSSFIPPNPSWGGYENLFLKLTALDDGVDFTPFPGNPSRIPITAEIVANGFYYEGLLQVDCGGEPIRLAWELFANGDAIDAGPVFSVRTSPCLPKPESGPQITNLYGYSGECPNGSACAVLQWAPWQAQETSDSSVQLPATFFLVFRNPAVRIGRFDALGADPDIFLAERLWYPQNDGELITHMPCIPPNTILQYAFTMVPGYYVAETGDMIYGDYIFRQAFIGACESLPYDALGVVY